MIFPLPLSFEKIQKELKTQVLFIRENLITFCHEQKDPKIFQSTLENIKSLLNILNNPPFSLLIPLIKALYFYFYSLQEEKIIKPTHLETLSLVIGELIQISDVSASEVEGVLNKLCPVFKQSEYELNQFTNPYQKNSQDLSAKNLLIKNSLNEKEKDKGDELEVDESLFNLLRIELESQCLILNQSLIEIEKQPHNSSLIDSLMRAAHSIKGAARVVSLNLIVQLAHAMEGLFVATQQQKIKLKGEIINCLFKGVDLLTRLSKVNFKLLKEWLTKNNFQIKALINQTNSQDFSSSAASFLSFKEEKKKLSFLDEEESYLAESQKILQAPFPQDRVLRVTAQNLNRLMGLAGELLVESRGLPPFYHLLQQLKKGHDQLENKLDLLRNQLNKQQLNEQAQQTLIHLQNKVNEIQNSLNHRLLELDHFIRRHASLSDQLYQEVISSCMRPFSDGVEGMSRLVRDLSHDLKKAVKLEIKGKMTSIDRHILEKLEAPLNQLIRNAIDHGIESAEERVKQGKSAEATIILEAKHCGGMLSITVSDDGRGINIDQLRHEIIEKNLVTKEIANCLTETEVIDFIFLPGFSTAQKLTEISGRGMGLNILQNFIQEVGGTIQTSSVPGKGLVFNLQLPLTLSVIRALLVEIAGEPYAFPLARLDQTFLISPEQIETIENQQFFHQPEKTISLVSAAKILQLEGEESVLKNRAVVVLSNAFKCYGLMVDQIIGEKELVVQQLNPKLGKIVDIAAGALMENGNPILIIDVEDIVQSIDNWLSKERLIKNSAIQKDKNSKKILVIDDSITVREVECRLLKNQGYLVETAVNGRDGWNALRMSHYDLVITDIDMPRMNGIELVRAIKADKRLHHLPVIIVSYKEGKEERFKGIDAGADYYLTKNSFHDATLLEAVNNLIGQP